jgi:hypothetical protein
MRQEVLGLKSRAMRSVRERKVQDEHFEEACPGGYADGVEGGVCGITTFKFFVHHPMRTSSYRRCLICHCDTVAIWTQVPSTRGSSRTHESPDRPLNRAFSIAIVAISAPIAK